ncbi:Panacea domain-containing protein [Schleiferilactobacillus shenzhenensis]|nr:type II toxin-antitoxin system antitoxin SocA domain-containing protein [Schleiferilactobacillus shenzhenensis]
MATKVYAAMTIANWFLVRHAAEMRADDGIDPMTQMKLHKLLYYAQGVHLAVTDAPLFSDDLLAWQHGPVVRSLYDRYKGQRTLDTPITAQEAADYDQVESDQNAAEILEAVYDRYGEYSAAQLREMTHAEAPWAETPHNEVISQDLIERFFKQNIVIQ